MKNCECLITFHVRQLLRSDLLGGTWISFHGQHQGMTEQIKTHLSCKGLTRYRTKNRFPHHEQANEKKDLGLT